MRLCVFLGKMAAASMVRWWCRCLSAPVYCLKAAKSSHGLLTSELSSRMLPSTTLVAVQMLATKTKAKQHGERRYRITERKKTPGGPKAQFLSGLDCSFHELPVINIKATYNNTLATVCDHNGMAGACSTGGTEGFKNTKKGTSHAGQIVGESIAKKAMALGVQRVRLKINGLGPGRQASIKGILSTGLQIVSITDTTPVPFNGPKPKKQRRV